MLCGYPPFLKDVIDSGRADGFDWRSRPVKLVMDYDEEFAAGNPTAPTADPTGLSKSRTLSLLPGTGATGNVSAAGGSQALRETGGAYIEPTVFTGVGNAMKIAQEEIFGPVLSVIRAKDFDHAIDIANNTEYGLSAGVWTEKGSRILWMVRKMKAGVVWANTYNKFDPTSPFGGYKESGFGREGGLQGLSAYVQLT